MNENLNNQPDTDNSLVEQAFDGYEGPYDLYRTTYKEYACGPTVGFNLTDTTRESGPRWVYADDLQKLGTWADVAKKGLLITHISVSSIVEGIDQTTYTYVISCADEQVDEDTGHAFEMTPDQLHETFFNRVGLVNADAGYLWAVTHGCETCARLHNEEDGTDYEGCDGVTPVHHACPDCDGNGVPI